MELDSNGLEVLSGPECLRLLATGSLGRIGLSIDALPAVLPVNYLLADDHIIIRTGRGTKLATATRNTIVAFEVDGLDAETGAGWSVMVRGLAREVSDPADLALTGGTQLASWLAPENSRHVAVSTDLVSGRRVPAPSTRSGSAKMTM